MTITVQAAWTVQIKATCQSPRQASVHRFECAQQASQFQLISSVLLFIVQGIDRESTFVFIFLRPVRVAAHSLDLVNSLGVNIDLVKSRGQW